jgi:hypothetical protein
VRQIWRNVLQLLDVKAISEWELKIPVGSTVNCKVNSKVITWKERTVRKEVMRTRKTFNSLLYAAS